MLRKILFCIGFAMFLHCAINAQTEYQISGYVSDARTGEQLTGATVTNVTSNSGVVCNAYGFYSLKVNTANPRLRFSFVGYEQFISTFQITQDTVISIELSPSLTIGEVTVHAERIDAVDKLVRQSTINLPMKQIEKIPSILGEKDIIKALQLLPGVQSGNEGTTGIYIRGGGADQNLILLDGVPVYNVSHFFGFFSVFIPESVKDVELIKGGFPARFGGRLSSVLDVRMKEGNTKKVTGDFSIGLLSSKVTVEGPIKKDKASFIFSARRTFFDILLRPALTTKDDKYKSYEGYYFQDINGKINFAVDEKNKLFVSFYTGKDKLYTYSSNTEINSGSESESYIAWGNITSTIRWNKTYDGRLFSNLTLMYGQYKYGLGNESEWYDTDVDSENVVVKSSVENDYCYQSGIKDLASRLDFDYYLDNNHSLKFGGGYTRHFYQPGEVENHSYKNKKHTTNTTSNTKLNSNDFFMYIEDETEIVNNFRVNGGLHFSLFNIENQNYTSIQPRISSNYKPGVWAFKLSYASMHQQINLLTTNGIGLPCDVWVPATSKIKPQRAHQITLGTARAFDNKFEFSAEAYYKIMKNLIEYKDGANFMNTTVNWQDKIESGKGQAYGIELFVQRKQGRLSGWIGYTLAWSKRKFANINNGKTFPYKYDRRHDLKAVAIFEWKKNIDLSATWVLASGNAITMPVSTYQGEEYNFNHEFWDPLIFQSINNYNQLEYLPERNNVRMKVYHRLDVGINFRKKKKHGVRTWSWSIYNVYNRQNPYFYNYETDESGNRKIKQVSLLPIIPSLTYNYVFD